jgi:hypothetical protein
MDVTSITGGSWPQLQMQLHDTCNGQTKGAVTKTLMHRRILAIAAVAATGAERRLSRVPFDAIAAFPNHQFSSSFELVFETNLVQSSFPYLSCFEMG